MHGNVITSHTNSTLPTKKVGTIQQSAARHASIPSWSMKEACSMDRHPSLAARVMPSAPCACAMTGTCTQTSSQSVTDRTGQDETRQVAPEHTASCPCNLSDGIIANGTQEMTVAVRNEIKYGSDWIKLLVTGKMNTVLAIYLCFSQRKFKIFLY